MLKAVISYVEAMEAEGFSEGGAEGSEALRRKGWCKQEAMITASLAPGGIYCDKMQQGSVSEEIPEV